MPSKLLTIGLLVPALLGSLSWVEKHSLNRPVHRAEERFTVAWSLVMACDQVAAF